MYQIFFESTRALSNFLYISPYLPSQFHQSKTNTRMATSSPSKPLTILSFFLFTIPIFAFSAPQTPLQSFIQCFLNQTLQSPQQLIFTQNSTSYQSILQSSSQNLRFLVSQTYKKPAAVVAATVESHVIASVICARKYGLQIRTRSGGHDYEALSYVSSNELVQDFVVVDLAALRKIDVDPVSRTAWVQAGATVGELYYEVYTRTNGTAGFPAAICPTVGIGGHISGGGIGTMTRKFGTAADNVVDARFVRVDGRVVVRKSMGEDLFWAIRGGGAASFGVVLAYQVRLVDVPPVVTAFNVNKLLSQNATKLVTRWQEIAPKFDKNLFIRVVAQTTTDPQTNKITIQAIFNSVYFGNRTRLLSVMAASFPELGLTASDCTEMNWPQSILFFNGMLSQGIGSLLNRTPQFNSSFKAKSDFVATPISETQWNNIWKFLMRAKDEPLVMIMEPFGGVMSEIAESATPFPHRGGNLYNIQYFMRWFGTDIGETQRHLDWMKNLYSFMTPYVSKNPRAAYVNYKDLDLGVNKDEGMVRYEDAKVWGESYFKSNFQRLATVKGRVDPHNFFRNEQSIPPLTAS